ncbi:MAG: molybdenum cofactor guanylyltransferase [Desulfobacterales bacterium]|jgi:molybdopterin-guanine dinucleotide biosynthesis protein A
MTHPCTGAILSGGLNTRFNGQNKAFIQVGQKRILDRLYGVFSDLFEDIILVTNHPLEFLDWDLTIVTDLFSARSSLTGIHAGLFYTKNPFVFFSACDTPFLKKELVISLIEQIENNTDIIMPQTAAGLEPLCSVYSKRCLKQAEQHLKEDKFKIQWAFQGHRIKYIPENVLREKDPELMSFFNINTPEDLIRAEEIIAMNRDQRP